MFINITNLKLNIYEKFISNYFSPFYIYSV